MSGLPHLRAALRAEPWAMSPDWLNALVEMLETRAAGAQVGPDEFARRAAAHLSIGHGSTVAGTELPNGQAVHFAVDSAGQVWAARGADRRAGEGPEGGSLIAVISVMGVIAQHASQVDDISGPGGTSTERVSASLRRAIDDPAVRAVILNIDSPGGRVSGVQELADEIFAARGKKPLVAQVNSTAASAAYWLACAAGELVATPGGSVGSIGVFGVHDDLSGAMAKAGISRTFISAGPYKTEGHPFASLGDEARAYAQAQVDAVYATFVASVARGRGTTAARVKAEFGQGRMVLARDALRAGMVDRVDTMQATLRRLGAGAAAAPAGRTSALASATAGDLDFRARRHRMRLSQR